MFFSVLHDFVDQSSLRVGPFLVVSHSSCAQHDQTTVICLLILPIFQIFQN